MANSQLSAQTNQTIQEIATLLTTLGECQQKVDALTADNGTITATMNKISDGRSKFNDLFNVLNQHGHIQILLQRNIICVKSRSLLINTFDNYPIRFCNLLQILVNLGAGTGSSSDLAFVNAIRLGVCSDQHQ